MRSSKREDLNIQSNFTSSFLSKSCRLPREQCSVTTANTEQSEKKPRKGFTFSFLRSFICQCRPTRVRTRSAVQYNSAGLLSTIKSSFFPGLHFFFPPVFLLHFFYFWASYMRFLHRTENIFFYLCENLGGALFHLFEMTLLKFLQPHPVALEESRLLRKRLPLLCLYLFL